MDQARPGQLSFRWRYFSLSQINNRIAGWYIWEQPVAAGDRYVESLLAFWAAEAARQQGDEAFLAYHRALLRKAHADGDDLHEDGTLVALAAAEGLDMSRFEKDLTDRSLLRRLQEDHDHAVQAHKIFGTPSLVVGEAAPLYLKLTEIPQGDAGLELWDHFCASCVDLPYVQEIKRPQ